MLFRSDWGSTEGRWANSFRLAHEQDGRGWEEMARVLVWSQRDSFWQGNILSAKKFREKYDQLHAQMVRGAVSSREQLRGDDIRQEADRLRGQGL